MLKKISFTITIFLGFLFTNCGPGTNKKAQKEDSSYDAQTRKSSYELVNEFLLKLKIDKIDTIIFYKRTCINCCDFLNVFWTSKGKKFLNKFYFDFSDMQTHSTSIELKSDKVFTELNRNYYEIKQTSIKGNSHKQKDGTSTTCMIDHYCYAELKIYMQKDSIMSGKIEDQNFDMYLDCGFDPNQKKETNDNFLENINSKWNSLLITIEGELSSMAETSSRELETLRTGKNNK